VVLNVLEFVDKVINDNDESDGSGNKLRSSKVSKKNNGDISMGWAKKKGGGTTTTRTANNGGGGKNTIGGGGGNESQ
jgi:hypothetical protein